MGVVMRATQTSHAFPHMVPCPPPLLPNGGDEAICVAPVGPSEVILLYPQAPEAVDPLPTHVQKWEVGDCVIVPEHGAVLGIITAIRRDGYYTVLSESIHYRVRGASALRPALI